MNAWPDLLMHRHAAQALDDVERVPRQARVVDDARCRAACARNACGQQADDVVALDELRPSVEEETAVVVAVPGDRRSRRLTAQRFERAAAILLEHGVRHAVRETAVRLVATLMNSNGRCGSSCRRSSPAPPLPAFTTILSGASARAIDVATADARCSSRLTSTADLADAPRPAELAALGDRADVLEARVARRSAATPRAPASCRCSRADCGSPSP